MTAIEIVKICMQVNIDRSEIIYTRLKNIVLGWYHGDFLNKVTHIQLLGYKFFMLNSIEHEISCS